MTSITKSKVAMKRPHLSHTERYLIAFLSAMSYRQKQIAVTLGRSPSCITRELKRNALGQGYDAVTAQEQASIRSQNSRNAKRIDATTMEQVKARLRIEHSPEQIAAHLPISHTRIYQLIRADKRSGGTSIGAKMYKVNDCPKTILNNLRSCYGRLAPMEKTQNEARWSTPWNPSVPVDDLSMICLTGLRNAASPKTK